MRNLIILAFFSLSLNSFAMDHLRPCKNNIKNSIAGMNGVPIEKVEILVSTRSSDRGVHFFEIIATVPTFYQNTNNRSQVLTEYKYEVMCSLIDVEHAEVLSIIKK